MSRACTAWLGIIVCAAATACGGAAEPASSGGGAAKVTIAGRPFDVSTVKISLQTGADGHFRIEGDDAANPKKDCVPGLEGGLALYGDIPSAVASLADLQGRELPFEFTGDGDDFNLCFVGSNGLLGVETGTVQFTAVEGSRVTFTFTGSFKLYDGNGGESSTPITASGSGTAQADK